MPRRTTRGPLDDVDPLSPSPSITSALGPSPPLSRANSSALQPSMAENPTTSITTSNVEPEPKAEEAKDLSFVLDPAIYHPVSQLEIPAPFRRPFPVQVTASSSLSDVLEKLEVLLSECNYLAAAFLAGSLLGSGAIKPTDRSTIFRVLAIRFSSLELSGNLAFAAQEAKALEDVGSEFYYEGLDDRKSADDNDAQRLLPRHIMPFALRLQALRLQSIGFSDPRRGVSALYDLALECRENIASTEDSAESRQRWAERLQDVGFRVVNALVEMGDFDCAKRTLDTLKPSEASGTIWISSMIMLLAKMGLIDKATAMLNDSTISESERTSFQSLLAIANEDFAKAEELLSRDSLSQHQELMALAKSNLAVAMLYKGEIERARSILNSLVDDGQSFQSLTINLATIFDLTSDRSKDLKTALAAKVARNDKRLKQPRTFTNADFKL